MRAVALILAFVFTSKTVNCGNKNGIQIHLENGNVSKDEGTSGTFTAADLLAALETNLNFSLHYARLYFENGQWSDGITSTYDILQKARSGFDNWIKSAMDEPHLIPMGPEVFAEFYRVLMKDKPYIMNRLPSIPLDDEKPSPSPSPSGFRRSRGKKTAADRVREVRRRFRTDVDSQECMDGSKSSGCLPFSAKKVFEKGIHNLKRFVNRLRSKSQLEPTTSQLLRSKSQLEPTTSQLRSDPSARSQTAKTQPLEQTQDSEIMNMQKESLYLTMLPGLAMRQKLEKYFGASLAAKRQRPSLSSQQLNKYSKRILNDGHQLLVLMRRVLTKGAKLDALKFGELLEDESLEELTARINAREESDASKEFVQFRHRFSALDLFLKAFDTFFAAKQAAEKSNQKRLKSRNFKGL